MANAMKYKESNQKFINDLFAPEGSLEKRAAAESLKEWAQHYVREDGYARRMMNPTPVTPDDFVQTDVGRDPYIIRTITPKSAGAINTFWEAGSGGTYMEAGKYRIYLKRSATPKYTIDKIYLTAYQGDLVTIFKDLSLMDLLRIEDFDFVQLSDEAVGTKGEVNDYLGVKQWVNAGVDMNPKTFAHALKGMTLARNSGLLPAKAGVHRSVWIEIMSNMTASEHSDELFQAAFVGDSAKISAKMWGIDWVSVLDPDLINPEDVYVYAPEENLGDFVTYQDAQMFTKVEEDQWLTFGAYSMGGMNFANPNAVFKVSFTGEIENWKA